VAKNSSMSMRAGPYPFPTVPATVRYFVALSLVVLVYLLPRSSTSIVDDGGLFLLLSITVLGSAWFGGTGAALLATVIGALLGAADAARTPRLVPGVQMHLAFFIVNGLLLTALVAELRRARRVAERQAQDALAARIEGDAANRMKDEFLATISHELRTPLNAVLGWMHLIRTGKLDRDTSRRGFESIERNVRQQAQLTSDLLDISKALTGKLRLETAPVSLKAVVTEAVATVATAASAKDVRMSVFLPEGPLVVRGDANRLRQIVWHLLANAIKFTPRAGVVKVKVEQSEPDRASIQVRDTGPGIDPEFLPRIFDRFTQADPSPTRTAGGLGVGLSLVRELVERHGGDIQARNEIAGRGAIFTLTLPLHADDQRVRPVAPMAVGVMGSSPPLDGLRVLVLDQDGDVRELLSTALQQRGATVQAVDSVAEALEQLEAWRPDVLVSDSASPEHDSYAVVGKVQSLEADRGGRIPALALTALSYTDEGVRRMLSSVRRDLPKPIEPAALALEIARLTGRERRRAQR
jgi:signal transduction histidine kinase